MKLTKRCVRSFSILIVLSLMSSSGIGQERLASSSNLGVNQNANRSRVLRIIITSAPSVSITADASLSDAVSYKSGKRFVVVIPQATVGTMQSQVAVREFSDFQFEQRGDDVAISFLLTAGTAARLDLKLNGLVVLFAPMAESTVNNSSRAESEDGFRSEPATFTRTADNRAVAERLNNAASDTVGPAAARDRERPGVLQPPRTSAVAAGTDLASVLNGLIPGASNKTAEALNVDLSVPESPAFAVLGLTPNTVLRPASPRDFASSLLNGLDQNGNFQSGIAIDTAPFMLFNGENITIRDYNEQYLTRLLSRTQFSFATTKGASSEDKATRVSAGLNLTLWDRGDPRIFHPERGDDDVLQCFAHSLVLPPVILPNTPQSEIDKINAANKAANDGLADACRARARKANWNRSSWTIAYAPSWISKTGETSAYKWNGGAFWTSVAYGFEGIPSLERIAQLIVHARHRTRERVPDPDNKGKFLTQNSTFFGARFRAGGPAFALNFEDSFIRTHVLNGKTDNINRFSIGAEARLSDNLYFVISSGSNVGAEGDRKKGFVLTSFKYGFNKKAQFNPQP